MTGGTTSAPTWISCSATTGEIVIDKDLAITPGSYTIRLKGEVKDGTTLTGKNKTKDFKVVLY
jgi:hypothetical protein